MKTKRGLIIVMTAFTLSLLSLCVVSPAATSHGGSVWGLSSHLRALSAAFTKAAVDTTVVLTVQVTDDEGKGISGARVNVYRSKASSLVIVPPDYQDDTSAAGIATFNIRVKTGEKLALTIEVSREDMQTETRDFHWDPQVPERVEKFILKAKTKDDQGNLINVSFNVQDDDFDFIEGVKVSVTDPFMGRTYAGVTGPDGSVIIPVPIHHNANIYHSDFQVAASKQGYKAGGKTITLYEKQIGTTVFGGNIKIDKMAGAARDVTITVHVTDGKSNEAVADANVRLEGPGNYSKTTDASGNATLHVAEIGTFTVTISQEYYEPGGGSILVREGDPSEAASFTLTAKEKKVTEPGDTIEVTVLMKDPTDEQSKPTPLPGALVKAGNLSVPTDGGGHATLKGAYDVQQDVTVEANGYKTQSKSVRLNKYSPSSNGNGSATFTLEPEPENTPLHLIVEVHDSAYPNNPIGGASVLARFNGRIVGEENTNGQGETSLVLRGGADASVSQLRSGIRLDVAKEKYKVKFSDITPDLLRPALKARRLTIYMERDWDELRRAVDAFEPKVTAWNGDARKSAGNAVAAAVSKALAAQEHAEELLKEIEAALPAFDDTLAPGARYRKAAQLQKDMRASERETNQKAQEIEKLVNDALASNCTTLADAGPIRDKYRAALKLHLEIATLSKKAKSDRDELTKLRQESVALQPRLSELRGKAGEIQNANDSATEAEKSAENGLKQLSDLRKNLTARQVGLISELSVLKVKYQTDTEPIPDDLGKRILRIDTLLTAWKQQMVSGPAPVDDSVLDQIRTAVSTVQSLKGKADKRLAEYQALSTDIDVLQETVDGIDSTFSYAEFQISQAAKYASDCEARNKTSSDAPTIEQIPEDKSDANFPKANPPADTPKAPTVEEIPEDKPSKPTTTKPATAPTTDSGGFWNAAKAGKRDVENSVTNSVTDKPAKSTNAPPTVEAIPEDKTNTSTAANNPRTATNQPPAVEEIPEDKSTNTAANKPAPKSTNPPPTVEEIPETSTNVAPNTSPRQRASTPPTVEEIPESETGDTASNKGRSSSGTTENSSGGNEPKKEKKPRDPNKPSRAEQLGTLTGILLRDAIRGNSGGDSRGSRGDTNPKPGTTDSGGTTGEASSQGKVDLTGLWVKENSPDPNSRYEIVLRPAGANTWEGSITLVTNRTDPGMDFYRNHYTGPITIVDRGALPGGDHKLHFSFRPKDNPNAREFDGYLTKYQGALWINPGQIPSFKKK